MIPFISNLFNLPVTRKEVLKRAKKYQITGLCHAIIFSLNDYGIYTDHIIVFPLFDRENAKPFKADTYHFGNYWWEKGVWNTGRMDFLNWLIEQYENDKTNLRKL